MEKGGFTMLRSKKVLGVTFAVLLLIVFICAFGFSYYQREAGTPPEEQHGVELVEVDQIPEKRTGEFLLVDDDNYVTVYHLPEQEIYEYTDVILDVLPDNLKDEIQGGKYLKDEEELYNFLENYTS
jgi:PDZ domain-containing secreted protein